MATAGNESPQDRTERTSVIPHIIIDKVTERPLNKVEDTILAKTKAEELAVQHFRKRSHSDCTPRVGLNFSGCNIIKADVEPLDVENAAKNCSLQCTHDNVTKRRKRSRTVTEVDRKEKNAPDDARTCTPPQSKSVSQPTSRSKLPNFAAIHRQQFQRMESIGDYIQRKTERAMNIFGSATKPEIGSSEKVLQVQNKNVKASAAVTIENKPKARSRINSHSSSLKDTYKATMKLPSLMSQLASGRIKKSTTSQIQIPNVAASSSRRAEIPQGVRTNRTFELQKRFRNNHPN